MTMLFDAPAAQAATPPQDLEITTFPEPFAYPGVPTIAGAHSVAKSLLSVRRPSVWKSTISTASFAHGLGWLLTMSPMQRETLTAAAWLHDIGHGIVPAPYPHMWVPASGALFTATLHADVIANYIAWSGVTPEESELTGSNDQLSDFQRPIGLIADALTYAITHTHPATGERCTIPQRLVALRARRGVDSLPAAATELAWKRLYEVEDRVNAALHRGSRIVSPNVLHP